MSSEANVRMRHSDTNKYVTKIAIADQKMIGLNQLASKPADADTSQYPQSAYNDCTLQNASALKVKNNLNKQKSQNQQHFASSQPRQLHGAPTAFRYDHILRLPLNNGSSEVKFFKARPEATEKVVIKDNS